MDEKDEDACKEYFEAKHFLNVFLNKMQGGQEISLVMAASSLLNIPSYFLSHQGWGLYMDAAVDHVTQIMQDQYQESDVNNQVNDDVFELNDNVDDAA